MVKKENKKKTLTIIKQIKYKSSELIKIVFTKRKVDPSMI